MKGNPRVFWPSDFWVYLDFLIKKEYDKLFMLIKVIVITLTNLLDQTHRSHLTAPYQGLVMNPLLLQQELASSLSQVRKWSLYSSFTHKIWTSVIASSASSASLTKFRMLHKRFHWNLGRFFEPPKSDKGHRANVLIGLFPKCDLDEKQSPLVKFNFTYFYR